MDGYHPRFPNTPGDDMPSSASPVAPRLAGHALVEALIEQGVDTVFGVPGDTQSQRGGAAAEGGRWSRCEWGEAAAALDSGVQAGAANVRLRAEGVRNSLAGC